MRQQQTDGEPNEPSGAVGTSLPWREPRVSFDVEVLAFPGERMIHCKGIDISASGMLLQMPTSLADDSPLSLGFSPLSLVFPLTAADEHGELQVHWVGTTGRPVRGNPDEDTWAVCFEDPLPWIALLLDEHLRRRLGPRRRSPWQKSSPARGSRR